MLIWIKDVPQFQIDNDKEVTTFIDKIITCIKPIDNPELLKNLSIDKYIGICIHVVKIQAILVDSTIHSLQ